MVSLLIGGYGWITIEELYLNFANGILHRHRLCSFAGPPAAKAPDSDGRRRVTRVVTQAEDKNI